MREKNLVILCIIFAVLIGLTFLKGNMKTKGAVVEEEASDVIATGISKESLTEIIIRMGGGQSDDPEKPKNVHLVKSGDHWTVKTQYGVTAREQIITNLLDKLDGLAGELRSNNKEILADYGIDDAAGVHVQLHQQGADYLDIVVGTKKAGLQNNFVRMGNSGAVYIVNENLLSALSVRGEGEDQKLDTNTWVDKRIAHMEPGEVSRIVIKEKVAGEEVTAIDLTRELVDGNKQWKSAIPYDINLSASKIKSMIETLNNTYAQEVVAADVQGAFNDIGWQAAITMEDGTTVELVRGGEQEGEQYYLKQEGLGYYFKLAKSTFNSRRNQQGAVFANNPLSVNESKITEVSVNDLENGKEFKAVQKEVAAEVAEGEEPKTEKVWETPSGEKLEDSKVSEILNKIKGVSLDAELMPQTSLEDGLTVRFVKEGETSEFTISKIIKLDTNKECRFLRVGANPQAYCASKSSIDALQKALP